MRLIYDFRSAVFETLNPAGVYIRRINQVNPFGDKGFEQSECISMPSQNLAT